MSGFLTHSFAQPCLRQFFCQHVRRHRFVGDQIGYQFLQPQVFLFQRVYVLQLRGVTPADFLAPRIKRGIRNDPLTVKPNLARIRSGAEVIKTIADPI